MGLSSSQNLKKLIQPISLTWPEIQEPISYPRQKGKVQGQKELSGADAAFPLFSFKPLTLQDELQRALYTEANCRNCLSASSLSENPNHSSPVSLPPLPASFHATPWQMAAQGPHVVGIDLGHGDKSEENANDAPCSHAAGILTPPSIFFPNFSDH